MKVLAVNPGSSSLKLSVIGDSDETIASDHIERWDGTDLAPLRSLVERIDGERTLDAVVHRVVHGGRHHRSATVIDDTVLADLADLVDLAPLHQPRSLAGIEAARAVLPRAVHIACFDTAFHESLPPAASTYAIPAEWRALGIRRYGFHGLSHAWASTRAAQLAQRPVEDLRTVVAHLGSGASLCAVAGGRSVDTTMGFTPLEGLVMATRSGSIDPGIVTWLANRHGLEVSDIEDALEHRSGLAGLTDGAVPSGDLRDVRALAAEGHEGAALALEVYVHRLRSAIGAMAASLGGLDVLAFTGGVGEHDAELRAEVCAPLAHLGLRIDDEANSDAVPDTVVGDGEAALVVIEAREDLQMAHETRHLLENS